MRTAPAPPTTTRPRRRFGFTMIELITVLVVVALLAGVAIVSYQNVVDSSRERADLASAQTVIREAIALHAFTGDGSTAFTQAELNQAAADLASGDIQAAVTVGSVASAKLGTVDYATDGTISGIAFAGPKSGKCILGNSNGEAWTDAAATCSNLGNGAAATAALAGRPVASGPTTSTTAPPTVTTSTYTMVTPGDTNGVFYALGTNFGAAAYRNPYSLGAINIDDTNGSENYATDGQGNYNYGTEKPGWAQQGQSNNNYSCTANTPSAYVEFDLGPGRKLDVNHYTWGNQTSGWPNSPRNWELRGSNDRSSWTTLDSHTNDGRGGDRYGDHVSIAFPVTAGQGAFRYLRVVSTGDGAYGGNQSLCFGATEFYGTLTTSVPSGTGTLFAMNSLGDTNGVIYNIGTWGNTKPFANPAYNNTLQAFSNTTEGLTRLTDRALGGGGNWEIGDGSANAGAWDAYLGIDLGPGRKLDVRNYTFFSAVGSWPHTPRNFALEGSNDRSTWTTVDSRRDVGVWDEAWFGFQVDPNPSASYRYFRIRSTGPQFYKQDYLSLNDIELYGYLQDAGQNGTSLPGSTLLAYSGTHTNTNGALGFLGSAGGTSPFANPSPAQTTARYNPDWTNATWTTGATNTAFTDQNNTNQNCAWNDPGEAWVGVDFGAGRGVRPSYYVLASPRAGGWPGFLRSWVLEGSDDASTWTVLDTHTNNQLPTNTDGLPYTGFAVDDPGQAYRYLRVRATGLNQYNQPGGQKAGFCLGHLEFYGDLK